MDSHLPQKRMSEAALPDSSHALMVSRTTTPATHEWRANEDDASHHHGLVSANEVPYLLALYWESKRARRTVHVGTYKLNIRRLAKAGFAAEKRGNMVRLRFVRDPDGTVEIRVNDSSPGLPIGRADF